MNFIPVKMSVRTALAVLQGMVFLVVAASQHVFNLHIYKGQI